MTTKKRNPLTKKQKKEEGGRGRGLLDNPRVEAHIKKAGKG